MIDERQFISRVEAANADEFAQILQKVDAEEERALRAWLGDPAFTRMRNSALNLSAARGAAAPKSGNVVVLHGILGGELSDTSKIWVNIFELAIGRFANLEMEAGGNSLKPISATGILKKYYGDLLLELAKNWNVRYLPFDWRADIFDSADKLGAAILQWFPGQPVHIVAHSMGGLVARALISRHDTLWKSMSPGKLVMLGTPNYGSFAIPLLFNGLNSTIKTVAAIDVTHSAGDLLKIAENFTGIWQMLPSLIKLNSIERLYATATYSAISAPQSALDKATAFQQAIASTIDKERMIYVAGYNRRTANGISDFTHLNDLRSYTMTMRGDGTVPHALGLLDGVETFYVDEEHGKLPSNPRVLQAINDLLLTGAIAEPVLWHGLAPDVPDAVRGPELQKQHEASLEEMVAHEADARALIARLHLRGAAKSSIPRAIAPEEGRLQDYLFHGFSLESKSDTDTSVAAFRDSAGLPGETVRAGHIRIHVIQAAIDAVTEANTPPRSTNSECRQELPIDAISVGHYVGVKPLYAELALDRAISHAVVPKNSGESGAADLILTDFTDRGVLRGELGQLFLIPDPRDESPGSRRIVAFAGMGPVGRFGIPEAAVLARELCWCLARLGKRHLATVLIGSGAQNLSIEDAVVGWLQGVQAAAAQGSQDGLNCLDAITFVELNPARAEDLKRAIVAVSKRLETPAFSIELCEQPRPLSGGMMPETDDDAHRPATRISAELKENIFRFGALTEDASVPERDVPLNPKLVFDVNDLIAAERNTSRLSARGEFLRCLLIPRDLDSLLSGSAPLVLACDSTVARIHWEMITQPHPQGVATSADGNFLGLCRGFTRQLRTTFAPAPEPPPPLRRRLRVLVIGDTASDMPLPGARAEALAICQLFEQVNQGKKEMGNSTEIVALIGPNEANWALVMERLLESPPFDILHYAGHCCYKENDPESSGWVFSDGNILSARELARVDSLPRFVFSNACESGITPSRADLRTAALAPGFAEMFFGRGVTNFICTAWPVDDAAAQTFALRLYRGLLGMVDGSDEKPELMHKAMREARRTIIDADGGKSWGAYQHYGNPYFKIFH